MVNENNPSFVIRQTQQKKIKPPALQTTDHIKFTECCSFLMRCLVQKSVDTSPMLLKFHLYSKAVPFCCSLQFTGLLALRLRIGLWKRQCCVWVHPLGWDRGRLWQDGQLVLPVHIRRDCSDNSVWGRGGAV